MRVNPWWVRWLTWRGKHGSAKALVALGHVCETQPGSAGIERANQLYLKAAELGNSQAMWSLGVNFLGSKGGKRNMPEALRWLHAACDKRHPLAMWAMGKMYLVGRLVEKDEDRGLGLLMDSASLGCESACLAVSDSYRQGTHGVERDPESARQWYLRSLPRWQRFKIRCGLARVSTP